MAPIPGLGGIASPVPVAREASPGFASDVGGAGVEAPRDALRWNPAAVASLLAYAQSQRSSAVIVVHRGEVIAERYWSVEARAGSPYGNQLWGWTDSGAPVEDVASLQKSIVSTLVGIAVDKGLIDLEAPVSTYLHEGWSSAACDEESAISVRHLLSMTSGLSPELGYQATVGTVWLYNTRAYSKVVEVLEVVTGEGVGSLTRRWLTVPLGMNDTEWRPRHGCQLARALHDGARPRPIR
jgi:CubicO group peptidase (beta-lactamase class C family)